MLKCAYKVGDIFKDDELYSDRARFCRDNNLTIVEIEPDEKGRRFQIVEIPKPTQKELYEQEIRELKQKLEDTDYVANKLAEANAKYIESGDKTEIEQLLKQYVDVLKQRKQWRERVNKLQSLR